jgi:predicted nucleic acid-binding protein
MINLFIDTNIFLNFYSFSDEHLDKLEDLIALIKKEKIRLFLTQQVIDEFKRNRERKLKKILEYISSFKANLSSPVICHDYADMKKIQNLLKSVDVCKKQLVGLLKKGIKEKSLKADKLIEEIFSISKTIEISADVLSKAKERFDLGNPPGKNNSYGDAVNWEYLLKNVPMSEDIFFVTTDKDYRSDINDTEFSPFLKEEWQNKKKAKIVYYDLLSKFLKEKFPVVKITGKEIKEEKEILPDYISSYLLSNSYPMEYPSIVGSGTEGGFKKFLKNLPADSLTELEKILFSVDSDTIEVDRLKESEDKSKKEPK